MSSIKALVISVGGNPEPILSAINRLHPECLCFFSSEKDQGVINQEIIPRIEQPPRQWDQMITPDPENLQQCCQVLIHDLTGIIRRWELEPSEVVLDIIGGTRTMAAALILCGVNYSSGVQPLGNEAEGSDLYPVNPWDELAVRDRKKAAGAFNRSRFQQSADLFLDLQHRVSGAQKPLYKALSNFALGYNAWDAFDYRQAWNKLQEAKKALEMATLFGGPQGLKSVVADLKGNLLFLEKLTLGSQEVKPELFLDLLSNARRRAQHEQGYEDAILRVYRALEVLAQSKLSKKGIRTSAVDPAQLPGDLKDDYSGKYVSNLDGKIKIRMDAAYRLLKALGDELGATYEKQWNNIKVLLEARNESILGHGFTPVKPERYKQLFDLVVKISGISLNQLPQFPQIDF